MCGGSIGKLFVPIRDAVESAATLAGNYLLPGSSLVTDHLVSKGSQKQLGSTLGKVANIASGLAGGGVGSSFTGIPAASSIGAGWENAANGLGNLVSPGSNIGTSVSNGLGSILGGSGASGAASGVTPTSFPSPQSAITGASSLSGSTPTLANAASNLTGFTPDLGSALKVGAGGGGSAFSNIGTLGTLLGGAASLASNDDAQKKLLEAQQQALGDIAPYNASGTAANSKLSDLLGTSGNKSVGAYGALTKPFTPSDLTNDPGYQFDLQQGEKALDRKNAATGNIFSGAALKEGNQFAQGLADNTYNNAFNRDMAQKQQVYGDLAGQAGTGFNAANTAAGINQGTGNARAGSSIAAGNTFNSTLAALLSGSGAKRPVNIGGQIVYV